MKRFFYLVTIIMLTSFFMFGCTNDEFDLSVVQIDAADQFGIVPGSYTVEYTIENLSDLVKEHGAIVTISVLDKNDQEVIVTGNTFVIEEDEVYSVTITLSAEGQTVVKTITVYAIAGTPMITVTYVLNGGTLYPESEEIEFETVPDLSIIPIKEGYTFSGWYLDVYFTQVYEGNNLEEDTVLYAKWVENELVVVIENPVTVIYDLNGAFQPELISETIEEGSHPSGLDITPIYDGYVFVGWSEDSNALHPTPLEELVVNQNVTLYAVWHYDYVLLDGTNYFKDFTAEENSRINEGKVEQLFLLYADLDVAKVENDFNIDSSRVEFGLLYTDLDIEIDYYDLFSNKIEGTLLPSEYANISTIPFSFHTLPLLSDTSYKAVFYMRFDGYLVVSDEYTFQSYITVPSGSVVGANYVLSGGYYAYDNGTSSFKPSMFIEILDGYSARLDHIPYSSYSDLYREGVRTLITKDLATGEEYLHVFHLDFQTPDVGVSYYSITQANEDITPTFRLTYPFDEDIYYHVSESGILYSYEHPFLKLDLYQVHRVSASLDESKDFLTANNEIIGNGRDIYVRAYVIINGKISYSDTVSKFEWNNIEYVMTDTFYMDITKPLPEYGYSYSYGSTNMNLCTITDSSKSCSLVYNRIDITAEGQYFITNESMSSSYLLRDVLIIDDIPMITGVEENGVYDHPVDVAFMMYNPYWYMEINGGEYIDLPQQIQLTEVGYYTIFYRTAYGMEEVHFSIVDKAE